MKKAKFKWNGVPSWDSVSSDEYIRECCFIYRKSFEKNFGQFFCLDSSKTRADWNLINYLYSDGRGKKVLACDFVLFSNCLINGWNSTKRYYIFSGIEAPFRQKHEQVCWKEKDKKVFSEKEQAKKDWRKHQKIHKDKQKRGYHQYGPGKFYKRYAQKAHRSWQRNSLAHENYEILSNFLTTKSFCYIYSWD